MKTYKETRISLEQEELDKLIEASRILDVLTIFMNEEKIETLADHSETFFLDIDTITKTSDTLKDFWDLGGEFVDAS